MWKYYQNVLDELLQPRLLSKWLKSYIPFDCDSRPKIQIGFYDPDPFKLFKQWFIYFWSKSCWIKYVSFALVILLKMLKIVYHYYIDGIVKPLQKEKSH